MVGKQSAVRTPVAAQRERWEARVSSDQRDLFQRSLRVD